MDKYYCGNAFHENCCLLVATELLYFVEELPYFLFVFVGKCRKEVCLKIDCCENGALHKYSTLWLTCLTIVNKKILYYNELR